MKGASTMRIALIQMSNSGDIASNLEKSIRSIKTAVEHGAELVLFPEVQLTEFFPQYLNESGKAYDASILIGKDGSVKGVQKMVHIAQADKFFEQDYYTPSDDGFKVFDTEYGRIGIVVCFDRHYPESIRTEALMGADLILIPTVNTKAEPSEMFELELRVQAFQNSVAIAMCNRVGTEGEMDFSGGSIVVDANGEVIAKASDKEEILYAEVDMKRSAEVRNSRPYTQLRRTELYK